MENWIWLPFTKSMFVSDLGRIKNEATGKIWRPQKSRNGYLTVALWNIQEKRSKTYRVHRLVAECFLAKEDGNELVNHKNLNKQDNRVVNLEWCTQKENSRHFFRKGFKYLLTEDQILYLRQNIESKGVRMLSNELGVSENYALSIVNGTYFKHIHPETIRQKKATSKKMVNQFDANGTLIKTHESIGAACRYNSFRISKIQRVLNGERRSYKGMIFKYVIP